MKNCFRRAWVDRCHELRSLTTSSASRPRRQWAQLFTASNYQHSANTRQSSSMGPTDNRYVQSIVRPHAQSHTPQYPRLNGCSVALRQGRYKWRHDNVLRILKRHFLKFWECLQRESTNSIKDAPFIHLSLSLKAFPNCRFDSAKTTAT